MSSASMTGFGRSSFEWAQIEYRIEIKSLNGKSLDLQIKATEPWAVLDNVAYKVLQQRLLRGKNKNVTASTLNRIANIRNACQAIASL